MLGWLLLTDVVMLLLDRARPYEQRVLGILGGLCALAFIGLLFWEHRRDRR